MLLLGCSHDSHGCFVFPCPDAGDCSLSDICCGRSAGTSADTPSGSHPHGIQRAGSMVFSLHRALILPAYSAPYPDVRPSPAALFSRRLFRGTAPREEASPSSPHVLRYGLRESKDPLPGRSEATNGRVSAFASVIHLRKSLPDASDWDRIRFP